MVLNERRVGTLKLTSRCPNNAPAQNVNRSPKRPVQHEMAIVGRSLISQITQPETAQPPRRSSSRAAADFDLDGFAVPVAAVSCGDGEEVRTEPRNAKARWTVKWQVDRSRHRLSCCYDAVYVYFSAL